MSDDVVFLHIDIVKVVGIHVAICIHVYIYMYIYMYKYTLELGETIHPVTLRSCVKAYGITGGPGRSCIVSINTWPVIQ